MNSNLKWKALFIAGVIVLCVYGLIGLPDFPTSWTTVKQNFGQRIKLGLDLQGGTHLILQVQVHEAVRQETDQVADQLSKLLRDKNVPFSEVTRNTDTQIKIAGVSPDQITTLRNVVSDSFGTWDLVPSPGEANSYLLNMRPSTVADVQDRTY
jgi:preprotein translocase subunit SecD